MSAKTFSVEATARPDGGFWRCGVHWTASAKVVDGLSLEQVEILEAEPKLVARRVHSDPSKRKPAGGGDDSKELAKLKAMLADTEAKAAESEAKLAEIEKQLEEATKPAPAKK